MTSVTRTGTLLAVATVAAGVLTAVPALAEPPSDPVSGLVGGLLGQQQHHERRDRSDYGRTHADDGILRSGCRNYPYRYVVTTPTRDWTLETFLDDRTGETIASGTYSSDADPMRDRVHFRFCRYSTYAGRFTIRAKVQWWDDAGVHKGWLEPSHFRLRRP
ncbi:hypothetical protein [Nocardioides sp. T2.26MG-1]|uniref:hypothetical protein n=1 Tax=Nocardioides sp. T2.26MG-1 TaxID=3041166 RepID=UPI00247775DF|nr:hypothetical protein [Nocardioides sp. T2.26MG-1]CAI9404581.1 hypothetical protein HIDPHFAB_04209 [Nocardioides sp. T2.26MG-1]